MSESTEELIAEAREYADALQGGENENWMRLVTFVDSMADALESTTVQLAVARAVIAEAVTVVDRDVAALANLDPVELRQILSRCSGDVAP